MKHRQDGSRAWDSYPWTYVSWVCRYWRWIAHTSPALLTTVWIDVGDRNWCKLAWVAASLERAAGALLDVSVVLRPSGVESWDTIRDLLLPSVSAIRRFVFTFYYGDGGLSDVSSLALFIASMTSLEVLRLDDDSSEHPSSEMLLQLPTSQLQKLRVLELTNLLLPTSPNLSECRSLRSLSIKDVFPHPNAVDLLSILLDCPHLETLAVVLRPDTTLITDRLHSLIPSVDMPSLRFLLIQGKLADIVHVCDRIRVPPTCIIDVFDRSAGRPFPPGVESMMSIVLPKQTVFRSVISACTGISLDFRCHKWEFKMSGSDGQPRVSITHFPILGTSTITPVWEDFMRMLSTVAITEFTFAYDRLHEITVDMWSDSLSRMPTLQVLCVLGGFVDTQGSATFPTAMFEAISTVSTATGTAQCPLLRGLFFANLVLDRITEEAFLRALQRRESVGRRLEQVCFLDCFRTNLVGEDFKERMQEYVDVRVMYPLSLEDAFRVVDQRAPTTRSRGRGMFNFLTRLLSRSS
ncbi:hypothetical protein DICSQDRAFT_180387 [Dichomitus squalens LYAD-421 SS1]|uniref:F-box domain-containing protein n=1 Tax=Dichomitus squalens (strain LYAD-421) TaxID=732165 RepID=R7T0V4_DICSQ|nr:uncharacterized protein DICSQDRAFT_180387 [Dichomitus squalens LYAD-421 SS1]EJF62064.1 hypothetical protein DICSQDRAFT_180387 [Dichomitus squalens LYAD-421 SS1]